MMRKKQRNRRHYDHDRKREQPAKKEERNRADLLAHWWMDGCTHSRITYSFSFSFFFQAMNGIEAKFGSRSTKGEERIRVQIWKNTFFFCLLLSHFWPLFNCAKKEKNATFVEPEEEKLHPLFPLHRVRSRTGQTSSWRSCFNFTFYFFHSVNATSIFLGAKVKKWNTCVCVCVWPLKKK